MDQGFEPADIVLSGRDEEDMLEKYHSLLDMLPLKIENRA